MWDYVIWIFVWIFISATFFLVYIWSVESSNPYWDMDIWWAYMCEYIYNQSDNEVTRSDNAKIINLSCPFNL